MTRPTKHFLLVFITLIILAGCIDIDRDRENQIKKPYAGHMKMASGELQLKLEENLNKSGIAFHKEQDGYILFSLHDYHHVQFAKRQVLGRIKEPWDFESIPPMHERHKVLFVDALKKNDIWYQIGKGPTEEIITWRGVDGQKVDLIKRDVMFRIQGLEPPN
ncbi:hypothetical protein [Amphritea sp. HPY]|uniref:hypothetical protein n=1 Tax=Amphritea sp. HPY TaxID=3421652 RepID=UPI003D7C41C3